MCFLRERGVCATDVLLLKYKEEEVMTKNDRHSAKMIDQHGPTGFVFFIAYLGAAVYFVQQSNGFWEVIVALIKAIVWPGFLTYHLLTFLKV